MKENGTEKPSNSLFLNVIASSFLVIFPKLFRQELLCFPILSKLPKCVQWDVKPCSIQSNFAESRGARLRSGNEKRHNHTHRPTCLKSPVTFQYVFDRVNALMYVLSIQQCPGARVHVIRVQWVPETSTSTSELTIFIHQGPEFQKILGKILSLA